MAERAEPAAAGQSYGDAYGGAALAAISRVNQELTSIFEQAGCAPIEPALLQPADPLFDLYGEEIWERAVMVETAGQPTLCLRPDFTVPVAQAYLAASGGQGPQRYGYFGPAFRRATEPAPDTGRYAPMQRLQAGIEIIGEGAAPERDAEVFALARDALKWCGVAAPAMMTGDLNVMFSLLDALAMPDRWRRQLKDQLWRPKRFQRSLQRFIGGSDLSPGRKALLSGFGALGRTDAQHAIAEAIALSETPHIGLRAPSEIADRLRRQAEDLTAQPISQEAASLIEAVLAVKGSSAPALARLRDLARAAQIELAPALDQLEARLDALSAAGVDIYTLPFDAAFGRNLEYYDGFVFEMSDPTGAAGRLAGGGRYDRLFRELGAPDSAADGVGVALWPEAIVAAAGEGALGGGSGAEGAA